MKVLASLTNAAMKQGYPILTERNFSILPHRGISRFDPFHEEKITADSPGQSTFCGLTGQ